MWLPVYSAQNFQGSTWVKLALVVILNDALMTVKISNVQKGISDHFFEGVQCAKRPRPPHQTAQSAFSPLWTVKSPFFKKPNGVISCHGYVFASPGFGMSLL